MKKVVIFGLGKIADVIFHYLSNSNDYEICAFTAETNFLPETRLHRDLPCVDFASISTLYPP